MSTPKTPSKKWRVYGANSLHEDYRSQSAAYDAVNELNDWGHTATVWHWEDGDWRLYERVELAFPHPVEDRKDDER